MSTFFECSLCHALPLLNCFFSKRTMILYWSYIIFLCLSMKILLFFKNTQIIPCRTQRSAQHQNVYSLRLSSLACHVVKEGKLTRQGLSQTLKPCMLRFYNTALESRSQLTFQDPEWSLHWLYQLIFLTRNINWHLLCSKHCANIICFYLIIFPLKTPCISSDKLHIF